MQTHACRGRVEAAAVHEANSNNNGTRSRLIRPAKCVNCITTRAYLLLKLYARRCGAGELKGRGQPMHARRCGAGELKE